MWPASPELSFSPPGRPCSIRPSLFDSSGARLGHERARQTVPSDRIHGLGLGDSWLAPLRVKRWEMVTRLLLEPPSTANTPPKPRYGRAVQEALRIERDKPTRLASIGRRRGRKKGKDIECSMETRSRR
jgi:hypothetical protein